MRILDEATVIDVMYEMDLDGNYFVILSHDDGQITRHPVLAEIVDQNRLIVN